MTATQNKQTGNDERMGAPGAPVTDKSVSVRGASMREYAKIIAESAVPSAVGSAPTLADFYLYLLKNCGHDRRAAENALTEYLEGKVPISLRECIERKLGSKAPI
jgi:hypothetical protein